jgi:hypothetical protein
MSERGRATLTSLAAQLRLPSGTASLGIPPEFSSSWGSERGRAKLAALTWLATLPNFGR